MGNMFLSEIRYSNNTRSDSHHIPISQLQGQISVRIFYAGLMRWCMKYCLPMTCQQIDFFRLPSPSFQHIIHLSTMIFCDLLVQCKNILSTGISPGKYVSDPAFIFFGMRNCDESMQMP